MKRLVFIPVLLFAALPAKAEEDLGTIEVTAARLPQPLAAAARTVTIIDRKAIAAAHAKDVVDLLKGQANINISDTTGVGAKSRVDLGGFGEAAAANVVALIDGRRINNPDLSGVDWSQIPLDQIERIEIVHGPASVLYGDGAVGGVINIITRVPESGGEIDLAGGSFGTGEAKARIGATADTARLEANLSGLSSDGYRANNAFERFDGGVRAEVDLPAALSLRLAGNHHRDRAGLPGALTTAQVAADRRQAKNPRDFSRTTDDFVDLGLNWLSDFGLELDVAGGIRRRDAHSEFVSFSSVSDFINNTRSIRPRLIYAGGRSLSYRLLIGADIERHDGRFSFSGATGTTFFGRNRDGEYATLSLGSDAWQVSGGARTEKIADHFRKTASQAVSQRKSAWDIGGNIEIVPGLRWRLNAARSLRFPLLDERFSFFSGTVDTTLLPQTGRHYSTGVRYQFADGWLDAAFSRADIDKEIFYNPLTFANANYSDKTRHDVVTVAASYAPLALLKLGAHYTYTKAVFRGGSFAGKRIPAVAKNRFGASWQADWSAGLTTLVKLTYVGKSFLISDQSNVRAQLPAYTTVDATASYKWRDLTLYIRGDNLTGKKYSSYGVFSSFAGTDNFYPAPERSFKAGASYRF